MVYYVLQCTSHGYLTLQQDSCHTDSQQEKFKLCCSEMYWNAPVMEERILSFDLFYGHFCMIH